MSVCSDRRNPVLDGVQNGVQGIESKRNELPFNIYMDTKPHSISGKETNLYSVFNTGTLRREGVKMTAVWTHIDWVALIVARSAMTSHGLFGLQRNIFFVCFFWTFREKRWERLLTSKVSHTWSLSTVDEWVQTDIHLMFKSIVSNCPLRPEDVKTTEQVNSVNKRRAWATDWMVFAGDFQHGVPFTRWFSAKYLLGCFFWILGGERWKAAPSFSF